MKKTFLIIILLCTCAMVFSFVGIYNDYPGEEEPVFIPPSQQRLNGDAVKGYQYLTEGDYVKGGLPYKIFLERMGKDPRNLLNRDSLNSVLPPGFTSIKAANGEVLVAPNCLQCHSQEFEGNFYVGLGNSFADFSEDPTPFVKSLNKAILFLKTFNPKQYQASKDFLEITKTVAPYIQTRVRGVNGADRLAAVLAAHRDPSSFVWNENALLQIPKEVIPSDTPPWWLLKKKNAMFYNGNGRGDFGKFLMASNLLTVKHSTESQEVDSHMPDLLAYIYSIEPPVYPNPVDKTLAAKGKILFENNCSKCHGNYGEVESYPNLLIPGTIVQTDSFLYKNNYSNPQFVDWFNKSWFTRGEYPARLEGFNGYIAPPLDGIWITAPYLHNGSVPTLDLMLDSKSRPVYWSRDFENPVYDYENVGWKYTVHEKPAKGSYDATIPGYGNYGHYFGDHLDAAQRKAVIEYLKTL